MSREMIVGNEHIVGANRDYDELMEMSGEPARPLTHHPMHPANSPTHAPQHVPAARHEIHHHYAHPEDHRAHERRDRDHHEQRHEEPRRKRLVSEEPTHERQFPVGFMFQNVAPGDEEDIEVKPQVYFRGERLAIPPSLARYFDILDIKVGKDSQLAATGTMPGESFSAHAVGVRMELDTAKPGIVITIRVRNVDTAPHDFKAVLYGAVME